MNVETVIHSSQRGYTIFKQSMVDFPAERFAEPVITAMNPPAWVIGHLTVVCDIAGTMVGLTSMVPEDYRAKYGPRSTPSPEPSDYPSKDEMLKLYDEVHVAVLAAVSKAEPAVFDVENPIDRMREELPTLGDMVAFMLTTHEGVHLGQLSAMRRAVGLKKMF